MADALTDILMRLVPVGSHSALAADANTSIDPTTDKLLTGFKTGEFFELDDYELGIELNDFDSTQQGARDTSHAAGGRFAAWRRPSTPFDQIKKLRYAAEFEPFWFTRRIDRASPILFQACCNSIPFASASVVRRRATGQTVAMQGFLRLDFTDVLLIGISIEDGEPPKEKCGFICRGLKMQYLPQASDGSLGAAQSAEWTQPVGLG